MIFDLIIAHFDALEIGSLRDVPKRISRARGRVIAVHLRDILEHESHRHGIRLVIHLKLKSRK